MNLLNYPLLPLKDPQTCVRMLHAFGIKPAQVAALTGYSAAAVGKWRKDASKICLPAVNAVNELTYRAASAYKAKALDLTLVSFGSHTKHLHNLLIDRAAGAIDLQQANPDLLAKLPPYKELTP